VSSGSEDPVLAWRDLLTDEEMFDLVVSHGGNPERGWWDTIHPHSLGWATARTQEGTLIGFVNVAWDGSDHAFLVDPKTRGSFQRRGIGTRLVRLAAEQASAADAWLCRCSAMTHERLLANHLDDRHEHVDQVATAVILERRSRLIVVRPLREAFRSRPDLLIDTWRLPA
jgi:ribosomal protein S18 acetylase RimI-like enzyme